MHALLIQKRLLTETKTSNFYNTERKAEKHALKGLTYIILVSLLNCYCGKFTFISAVYFYISINFKRNKFNFKINKQKLSNNIFITFTLVPFHFYNEFPVVGKLKVNSFQQKEFGFQGISIVLEGEEVFIQKCRNDLGKGSNCNPHCTCLQLALAFLLPSKIPKIKITIVSEKFTLRKNVSHNFSCDTESCLNSLSLDISRVFAWNVCGLSLSILRCDLCLTNRFYLVILKKLTESISISGKLEKNQIKKSVVCLQKLFLSITYSANLTSTSSWNTGTDRSKLLSTYYNNRSLKVFLVVFR